ncbi:MAG: hypothetical protein MZV65_17250 [Chromatiales bacterium]|nr:hypothetical protein [Chromatiales bacterium]
MADLRPAAAGDPRRGRGRAGGPPARARSRRLVEAGLAEDEAFLIAVKRMGDLDALSREFAREHSERLWKRLVVAPGCREGGGGRPAGRPCVAVGLAVAAAVAIKVPELFGVRMDPNQELRAVLRPQPQPLRAPVPGRRSSPGSGRSRRRAGCWLAAPFVRGGRWPSTSCPFAHGRRTPRCWRPCTCRSRSGWPSAIAYAGGRWREHDQRMNFVRFSGEWFIYYALIALGGGVLDGAHGVRLQRHRRRRRSRSWRPGSCPAAPSAPCVIAAWLVEAKQSVIENMAPVLTLPLHAAVHRCCCSRSWRPWRGPGSGIDVEREVLIGFDLLLVVVLGLRPLRDLGPGPAAPPGLFDALQLVLRRLRPARRRRRAVGDRRAHLRVRLQPQPGGRPGRERHPAGEPRLVRRALRPVPRAGAARSRRLERWQTAYIPVYAVWAWIVVVVFPLVFRFQ